MSTPYQLTPAASKHNAFCWLTWPAHIDWSSRSQDTTGALKRGEILDAKRAAGIDPARIPGMGNPSYVDPKRFTVYARAQSSADASRTETLRASLRLLGPQSARDLATVTHMGNPSLVGALLKNDIRKRTVRFEGGVYSWVGEARAHG